jgi:hypothetical protein
MIAAIAVALGLLCCQEQTPEQELAQKMEAVGSWLATLQMAGEKWSANSVPGAFVRTSAKAADSAFEKAEKVASKSDAGPEAREGFRQVIAAGEMESGRLRRAVEADDRASALPIAGRLRDLKARFDALRKRCEGRSS